MLYFIKIFFNLSLGNMLINLDNMLIFFSKRASGMLIKKHVLRFKENEDFGHSMESKSTSAKNKLSHFKTKF